MPNPPAPALLSWPKVWNDQKAFTRARMIPEETAVAFTYQRETYAVMMATPSDLDDFAVGFSLNEGIINAASEIEALEIAIHPSGVELRMDLTSPQAERLWVRRRAMRGATGCGLCGVESLQAALPTPPRITHAISIPAPALLQAMAALGAEQTLNRQTHGVHAAAFWSPAKGLAYVREDVGRHNALDKLAGALARDGVAAASGAVLLTSRISVELVQKTAMMGAPIIVAISVPTALAVRVGEAAGVTLVGIARSDGFEIFTHPERILMKDPVNAA
jgi:FdhD protein